MCWHNLRLRKIRRSGREIKGPRLRDSALEKEEFFSKSDQKGTREARG